MSIDLRLLRYATALAEHGSFTRAAEALGIAQPTLSRGIADLEAEVGQPLFTRHRHGVEATDFGYLFLRQATAVSAQMSDLEREVAIAKGLHRGELAVGLGPYAAEVLLPLVLPAFVSEHPGVRLRIQVESLEVLGRALRDRTLDLVVGERTVLEDDESIEVLESLEPVRGYLFARAGHPLTAATPALRDVLDYPLIQVSRLPPRLLKPFLEAAGLSPKAELQRPMPALDCPSVHLAAATVAASDAVVLASLGLLERDIERGRIVPILRAEWMRSAWAFMKLRNRSQSPAAIALMAALREANAAALAHDRKLEKRWRALLPPAEGATEPPAATRQVRRAR